MFTCKEYKKAESLEEAWTLNQKRGNLLIGGMLWVKMGQRRVQTVIDLSGLGLNEIEEDDEEFRIGCMTTLRQMETHKGLLAYTNGAVRESLCHIVGVQFRNVATVGGSIFGRFGFSDVLTMLLAMDSFVELYKGGVLPMAEFVNRRRDRDILVRIIIKKTAGRFAYQSVRGAKTDFPTLAVAAARMNGTVRLSIGARPARAMLLTLEDPSAKAGTDLPEHPLSEEEAGRFAGYAWEQVPVGSNLRGSAEYRRELVKVLVKRACISL